MVLCMQLLFDLKNKTNIVKGNFYQLVIYFRFVHLACLTNHYIFISPKKHHTLNQTLTLANLHVPYRTSLRKNSVFFQQTYFTFFYCFCLMVILCVKKLLGKKYRKRKIPP